MKHLPSLFLLFMAAPVLAGECPAEGVALQILGSGGQSLNDGRASSSYLVWHDNKSRILVNAGSGVANRFKQSRAVLSELDAILFNQLSIDHTGDMANIMNSTRGNSRSQPLIVYGPQGNKRLPSTVSFIRALFDQKRGAYRELGWLISPLDSRAYKLRPKNVPAKATGKRIAIFDVANSDHLRLSALTETRRTTMSLSWRITVDNKTIVILGNTTDSKAVTQFSKDAQLLIIPLDSGSGLSPAAMGHIAYRADTRHLVLSRRTANNLGREEGILSRIKEKYAGLISFANDMECIAL